jgi:hypothetical protein
MQSHSSHGTAHLPASCSVWNQCSSHPADASHGTRHGQCGKDPAWQRAADLYGSKRSNQLLTQACNWVNHLGCSAEQPAARKREGEQQEHQLAAAGIQAWPSHAITCCWETGTAGSELLRNITSGSPQTRLVCLLTLMQHTPLSLGHSP